jgi:hypothetical protein
MLTNPSISTVTGYFIPPHSTYNQLSADEKDVPNRHNEQIHAGNYDAVFYGFNINNLLMMETRKTPDAVLDDLL